MTVSVAIIVKNGERTLGRCLDSLSGHVDEIVVVDTGSDDATAAIARRYTEKIHTFAWCDDFAAARQFAFDRATSDWVMWVDADDVVAHAERIRPLLADAPAEIAGYYWRYVIDWDAGGNPRCVYWRERCVRNDGRFRWVGRVHEVLTSQEPHALVQNADVVVEHYPPPGPAPEKEGRNLRILEAEYAECEGFPSTRLLFYLGREYADAGNYPRAIEVLEQYLRLATWDDERYLAQIRVADLERAQANYAQALDADLRALKICPRWPDAYFGLAETYYFLEDWPKVVHWTEIGRAMPLPDTMLFTNPLDYRYNWIIYYTNALHRVGQTEQALSWTRHALEIAPDDAWHRHNFDFFTQTLRAR
jgi:glycosyltransferase involved in cell wall biosynthesis